MRISLRGRLIDREADKMAGSGTSQCRNQTAECDSGLESEQDVTPYDFSKLKISSKSSPKEDRIETRSRVQARSRRGRMSLRPPTHSKTTEPTNFSKQTSQDKLETQSQTMNDLDRSSSGRASEPSDGRRSGESVNDHPYNTRSSTQTVIKSEDLKSLTSLISADFDESDDELKSIHSEASLSSCASRVSFKRKRTQTISADQEVESFMSRASSSERHIESCGSPSPTQFSPVMMSDSDSGCTDRKRHCSDASDVSHRPYLDLEKMQYKDEKKKSQNTFKIVLVQTDWMNQDGPTTRQMVANRSFTPLKVIDTPTTRPCLL